MEYLRQLFRYIIPGYLDMELSLNNKDIEIKLLKENNQTLLTKIANLEEMEASNKQTSEKLVQEAVTSQLAENLNEELSQTVNTLKHELATAKKVIAIRDNTIADLTKEIKNLNVDIKAIKTKLTTDNKKLLSKQATRIIKEADKKEAIKRSLPPKDKLIRYTKRGQAVTIKPTDELCHTKNKRPNITLTVAQEEDILARLARGESQVSVAVAYDINRSKITRLIQKKENKKNRVV